MSFRKTRLASQVFSAQFDPAQYLERTRRNRYWLGSEEAQMRLRNLRVGIAGLGGMGSNIAEILVRLGVGYIKIADPDVIEASNLNRQVIANQSTLGVKKALASARELQGITRDCEVVVYDDGITEANAAEFVEELDILVDEIDVAPLRPHVWLHQAARKHGLPIYSGYIIGMGTHIYKFQGEDYTFEDFMLNREDMYDRPTLEFLFDRFYRPVPSYVDTPEAKAEFMAAARSSSVPIFGASTYGSQSCLVIRMIADLIGLPRTLGVPETPVMPKFIKLDALDYTLTVCDIRDETERLKKAA